MNALPWVAVRSLTAAEWHAVRQRAILECFKWDQQAGDNATLAWQPIVLRAAAWAELRQMAEALARECAKAEEELLARPELHSALGLPWAVRRALRRAERHGPTAGIARLIRFDFHYTDEGWRISEANTDVPGGHNEADGYAELMREHYSADATPLDGSPVRALIEALRRGGAAWSNDALVGLVHATSYTDDRQVMLYLERAFLAQGLPARLLSPADLRWNNGRALAVGVNGALTPLGAIVRFFPAEWLPNLPRRSSGWKHFFAGGATPVSNPGAALLTQSKRFPLVWDRLRAPLPVWRALLPSTFGIPEAGAAVFDDAGDWIVKPALGRVGEGVGAKDLLSAKDWTLICRDMKKRPEHWAAQRRFQPVPLQTERGPLYPCIGVYTVDGQAAGAYGRLSAQPIVDATAQDTAVLIEK